VTISHNSFAITDFQRPRITITRAYSAEKNGGPPRRACDPILHKPLFFDIQQSLLMGDVFVTMLAYRTFFPNCAWRAKLVVWNHP